MKHKAPKFKHPAHYRAKAMKAALAGARTGMAEKAAPFPPAEVPDANAREYHARLLRVRESLAVAAEHLAIALSTLAGRV